MIEYNVSGTRFSDDGVRIDFRALDEYGQISLNGYVPVTTVEFFTASTSMEDLEELVKSKVIDRLTSDAE